MARLFNPVFWVLLVSFSLTPIVCAQTTEISFQGSLKDGGVAANGNYDFEFALFDASIGGTQLGLTQTRSGVAVANGIFSVSLDFGLQFPGPKRFLQIRVSPAGGGSFTTLTPRQQINSAPYSIKSLNTDNAGNAAQLGGIAAGQYVVTTDPRMSDARPPLPNSANYIWNQNSVQQASSNFIISGDGIANGTLSGNVVNATTQYNINNNRILSNAGSFNLFAGVNAGAANTGTFNSFFGALAGQSNTTGDFNSYFGVSAGQNNVTGNSNSFFGRRAGRLNIASSNSFCGALAGDVNSTGSDNSFFGANAGDSNTVGNNNSFYGRSAGATNTDGDDNSFFGRLAGTVNIASDNSFFGSNAGAANSSGFSNAFFGAAAGRLNTTGTQNSLFGASAAELNTTGNENSVFGHNAGYNNEGGNSNSYFGASAGFGSNVLPPGNNNSFFGRRAGASNHGNDNSFFGESAGQANNLGSSNSFFGRLAGNANVSSSDNSFFGHSAGVLSSGASNSFFGRSAGLANTSGQFNSFFGRSAGATNTTGSFNTIIGYNADLLLNDLTYATAIGAGAVASTSDSVTLGRSDDIVYVPGFLRVVQLGSPGATAVCRNVNNTLSTCSSSLRYKTNLASFEGGMSFVSRLRPISFDWKDGGMKDIGFGAEDVAEIDPRFVTYNEKGEVEGVQYDRLSVAFVNAFKEQQAQISDQRSTISTQQNQIEQQQKQIELLMKALCSLRADLEICKIKE